MTNYETSGVNQHRAEPSAGRERARAGPAPASPVGQSQALPPHTPSPCPFSAPLLCRMHTRCHSGQVTGVPERGRAGIMAQGLPPCPGVCLGKVSQDKGNLPREKTPKGWWWQAGRQQWWWSRCDGASPAPGLVGSQGGLWLALRWRAAPCLHLNRSVLFPTGAITLGFGSFPLP